MASKQNTAPKTAPAPAQVAQVAPAPAVPFNPAQVAAQVAAMLNATMPLASVHNAVLQAVKLAQTAPAAPAALTMAYGGHACAGWRKPALQHIAAAFGLVPCLQVAAPAPQKPQGQQASFYGNANAAAIAAALYNAVYTYTNVNGNKLLRDARAAGHAAGKTGAAGNRLQQNVYNDFALTVLAQLQAAPAVQVAPATQAAFASTYNAAPAKGGLVLSGAYVASAYNGTLPIVTPKA